MQDSTWDRRLSQPALIAIFTTCLFTGFLNVLESVAKQWHSSYMVPLLFIIAFWAFFNYRTATAVDQWTRRTIAFRVGQALIIILVARLLVWASGGLPGSSEIAAWLVDPARIFDIPWVFSSLLGLGAWAWAGSAASIFHELRLSNLELTPRSKGYRYNQWADEAPLPTDRTGLVRRFSERFVFGGMILALCAALLRIQFQPPSGGLLGIREVSLPLSLVLALIGYTLSGLALISAGRLGILRARWQLGEISVKDTVNQRWVRYVITFVGITALLAALLPLGNTWGLAAILYYVLNLLYTAIEFLLAAILFLVGFILSLLGGKQDAAGSSPAPLPPPVLPTMEAGAGLPAWLGGAVFWVVAILVGGYALLTVLQNRNLLGPEWSPGAIWARLLKWWQEMGQRANQLRRQVKITVPEINNPLHYFNRSAAAVPGNDPRSRVRFFYRSMLAHAAEVGAQRKPTQTPLEYEQVLRQQFPDAELDAAQLTEAFMEARYNSRPIADQEASQAETWWQRLRDLLRKPDDKQPINDVTKPDPDPKA